MLVLLHFLAAVHDNLLQVRGQGVELLQAHCDVNPCAQVLGADHIILDLVEGAVLDHGQRVFLAFNGALLKAGEHLG